MNSCPNCVSQLIGNTPMLTLNLTYNKNKYRIFAKAEFVNPSGSVKDRIARYIMEKAEQRGELKKGMTIVEATSGNTGIALAMVAAAKGYKMIVVMPEHMSKERVRIIRSLGAKVILTPKQGAFLGAIAETEKMARADKSIFLPKQFSNPDNVECHELTTGREILHQVTGPIDAFVAGVGTGGTLMGVYNALKPEYPKCVVTAVEPAESAVMSGEKADFHKIQGIGDEFIPEIVDMKKVERIEKIASDDAIQMSQHLAHCCGLMVGISTGANVLASLRVAESLGRDKTVVTVLPDRCERYFSTDLYARYNET